MEQFFIYSFNNNFLALKISADASLKKKQLKEFEMRAVVLKTKPSEEGS